MTQLIAGRFIDLSILQSVPFANLNRDDTNSIKTVQYGGVNRTRVSSQCWKRAIRLEVERETGQSAMRTRRLAERLSRHLTDELGWPADLATRAGIYTVVASSVGAKAPKSKKDGEVAADDEVPWGTNAMVYVPDSAVAELAAVAVEHRAGLEAAKDLKDLKTKDAEAVLPKDEIDAILRSRNGIINLTGRMLAELNGGGVDGAVQVAHVLTTHATDVEIDYFSAVDDITATWGDQTGSAHMGHNEYSAGTFYRYVTVDLAELLENTGDEAAARELAAAFLAATVLSLPQAKKNSTAPHTVPDLIAVSVRSDRPLSYAAAFEKPVAAARDGFGYTAVSITALDTYAGELAKLMGERRKPVHQAYAGIGAKDLENLGGRAESIDDLVGAAIAAAFAPRPRV